MSLTVFAHTAIAETSLGLPLAHQATALTFAADQANLLIIDYNNRS